MVKKIFKLVIITLSLATSVHAQYITPEQYVEKYKDLAIREMKRMGVPAAITLAQGLLETENGNSDLVKKSNNHFGIKCKITWNAPGVSHDDDAPGECFRSYKDAEASYRDHSNYLRGNDRYASLFALNPTDYKAWAKGLRKAGYATNPKYPDILIRNIEQYNLQQYSLSAANEIPKLEKGKYEDDKEPAADKIDKDNPNQLNPVLQAASQNNNIVNIINGNKCLIAKKGTSLLAIATENNIDLSKLLVFNDLENDGILSEDQIIFLQKKSKIGAQDFYIVQQQESLYTIAQKNGIQLSYLLAYNQLGDKSIAAAGKKLYLNASAETQQAELTSEKTNAVIQNVETGIKVISRSIKIHEVQAKEGLYAISKMYQVTVQQLRDWNNLTTDDLKIGQQLVVSK